MAGVQEEELDSLASLEERIHRAIELVNSLRQEKDAAVAEAVEARAHAKHVSQELEVLRSERTHVRTRIEKLLGQMDLLGAS